TNSDNDDNISFTDFEHFTVYGGAGDDRLATFGGDDLIEGGVGNDELQGGGGNDMLIGGEGSDTMIGGAGDDIFIKRPGEGDDIITDFQKGAGPDDGDKIDISAYDISLDDIVFEQEAGGFRISLGSDSILLQGISHEPFEVLSFGGNTAIRLASDDASLLSAAGERFITRDEGANRVYGDDGDDVAVTGAGDDLVSAGAGSDVVVAGAGMDTIIGGLGADNLTGGADADLFAFSADDFGAGFTADFITDFIPGEDVIELSGLDFTDIAGLNFVTVAEGDALDLGAGRFIVLEGLTAGDLSAGDIVGAEFARTYGLVSTTAVYRLTEAEDRFVSTGTGPSEIIGRAGTDAIVGGSGDDTIRGEEGADRLIGGAGADELIGGQGADQMTGLSGADTFVFTAAEETGFVADFITDYELGIDTLTLLNSNFTSYEDLNFTTSGAGDIALQLAPTHFVVFEGHTDQGLIENESANWTLA
ncbi:M10 family metallopeptidase C-terminal domain-containing protein, partial [Shimia sp. R9_3]|uniref:M10 family metallopeptidase C-terminal domain-containing protein n=1 Tax=Shimia sp. R9_3 TaxID=2821113 RepID=UPI001ADBFBAF|nr:M10 family metallopeptidase C-terminal domain-containing protein [Shimia sp. R9_3]